MSGLETSAPLVTADHEDQLLSGVDVLPLRVSTIILVPAGRLAFQLTLPQNAIWPASKTTDV